MHIHMSVGCCLLSCTACTRPKRRQQPKQQHNLPVRVTNLGAELNIDLPGLLQLTGGISKGLAMLTLDQDYISRFRNQPMTYQQRLVYALQALGVGIYEGVIGQPASLCLLK